MLDLHVDVPVDMEELLVYKLLAQLQMEILFVVPMLNVLQPMLVPTLLLIVFVMLDGLVHLVIKMMPQHV
jgi:hypothetical protein